LHLYVAILNVSWGFHIRQHRRDWDGAYFEILLILCAFGQCTRKMEKLLIKLLIKTFICLYHKWQSNMLDFILFYSLGYLFSICDLFHYFEGFV
jgi:hypothetical protein